MSAVERPPVDEIQSLYIAHHGWLNGWLRRRLGNAADAADLAQDTFTRLLARDAQIAAREPRAFLATVAHGLVANFFRRRQIEQAYLEALAALPVAHVPDLETRAIVLETLVEIDRRLQAVPPAVRSAFLMFQLDGVPQAEIAAQLEVSVATVQRYLVKALHQCCFSA
ncbi:sigma-70 family RNA polymerase sigma factor [Ralstonia insidiosa]|uniref:RNA polymerase subunit sigma n=1 Tax=Ralstonia insidiosa TaxID=190721 RepID=A0A192A2K9_9RALS|nr:sigma-70 family RNA polymerase sigma factor [Ralstonia insidiosa]ANJ74624.1 RNA polymerase subunit sigma [Ralstonia insidiosa]KAB0469077.1 sigma-70 family RNA polymerase sigma factor [Ralstonia insidiosa]MBY4909737.1 sigma-70 family RNA polymerase sigma factor [Ralstonia insidiosa]